MDPVLLWIFVFLALAADRRRGPGAPRGILPAVLLARQNHGTGPREEYQLRMALAPMMGRSSSWAWQDELPPAGLVTPVDGIAAWLLGRMGQGDRLHPGIPGVDMPLELALITHWSNSPGVHLTDDLSFPEALHRAQAWWANQAGWVKPETPLPDAQVLVRFPDGSHIDRLVTPSQFDEEGLSMDHCLRRLLHYWFDHARGEIAIYSYRDRDSVPRGTFEIDLKNPETPIVQFQGPRNGPIHDPDARRRLAWFITQYLGIPQEKIARHWLSRMDLATPERTSWESWTPVAVEGALPLEEALEEVRWGTVEMVTHPEDPWVLQDLEDSTEALFRSLEETTAIRTLTTSAARIWAVRGSPTLLRWVLLIEGSRVVLVLSTFDDEIAWWAKHYEDLKEALGMPPESDEADPSEGLAGSSTHLAGDPLEALASIGVEIEEPLPYLKEVELEKGVWLLPAPDPAPPETILDELDLAGIGREARVLVPREAALNGGGQEED